MAGVELDAGLAAEVRSAFAEFGVEVVLRGTSALDAAGRDYGLGVLLLDLARLRPEPAERAALVRMHVRRLVAPGAAADSARGAGSVRGAGTDGTGPGPTDSAPADGGQRRGVAPADSVPSGPVPSGSVPRDRAAPEIDLSRPRPHHYRFAHRVLPTTALDAVSEDRLPEAVRSLWDQYGAQLPPEQRVVADGLDAREVRVGAHRVRLVVMPRPQAATEAFAVARAFPSGGSTPRTFTLEYGVHPLTGERGAVLGEWRDGNHLLLQLHVPVDLSHFLQEVGQRLDAERPRRKGFFRR